MLHIPHYSKTLNEYERLKSGMKSMGNGAYSALYIINAVSVSKEFELSRFYCILNCTICKVWALKKILLISSVIFIMMIVSCSIALLCWFDNLAVGIHRSLEPLILTTNLSFVLLFIISPQETDNWQNCFSGSFLFWPGLSPTEMWLWGGSYISCELPPTTFDKH